MKLPYLICRRDRAAATRVASTAVEAQAVFNINPQNYALCLIGLEISGEFVSKKMINGSRQAL